MCLLIIIGLVLSAIGAATTGQWAQAAGLFIAAMVVLALPALFGHENG